jgi:hypothetical protein
VAVAGVGAVSAYGLAWRGLGRAVGSKALSPAPARELAATHPGVLAFEVPPIPPADDAGDARARKAMSRPARFAAIALRQALDGAGFRDGREGIGYFLGVGASGGPIGEMEAMMRASLDAQGAVSLARLGAEGLQASNPLFTFHVLNNFSLCHGAILEGVQGPNAALFSRGGGTVSALVEAMAAIAAGDCDRAVAGGADTALHPVTWSELSRDGHAVAAPGEGAGLLALERADAGTGATPLGFVESVALVPGRRRDPGEVLAAAARDATRRPVDRVLIAPSDDAKRERLGRFAAATFPGALVDDVTAVLGEALAATPALGWVAAMDRLACGDARRIVVVSAGVDGDVGVVTLARELAP